MKREQIIGTLKEIVKPYTRNQAALDNLTEKTDLLADLKINSANLVDVILDIEESFAIIIDNDSMQQMLNIESVVEIIQKKMSQQ
jgi:acyl carrier protein